MPKDVLQDNPLEQEAILTAQRYLQERLGLLSDEYLPPMPQQTVASVVIPLYGEELADVIERLHELSTQKGVDVTTIEAVCVINSPNHPREKADFLDENEYQHHMEVLDRSRTLNTRVSAFIQLLKLPEIRTLCDNEQNKDIVWNRLVTAMSASNGGEDGILDDTQKDTVWTILSSGLTVHEYNIDAHRLPDEDATLGGARDIGGVASIAARITNRRIPFTRQNLQRLEQHVIIQTDADSQLPANFVQGHLSHYEGTDGRATHAVLGEVDIHSSDPNTRILGLQARLKNRVRFHGFSGYAHETGLGAQHAATGCNLSYRVLSAMRVGGIPHQKSLDDWRFVTNIDTLQGTYLDNNIRVRTSPRNSPRAIGGYGSAKLDYLRTPRFFSEEGAYQDVFHAVYGAYILDKAAAWYAAPQRPDAATLIASLEQPDQGIYLEALTMAHGELHDVSPHLQKALTDHQTFADFQKSYYVDLIRRALWTRSLVPVSFRRFIGNLEKSLHLINQEQEQAVRTYVDSHFQGNVPEVVSEQDFNKILDTIETLL